MSRQTSLFSTVFSNMSQKAIEKGQLMGEQDMEKMSAVRKRTDREIRESFLRLLEEKPLKKITVQDICTEAEINRATFYRYYRDVYALYDAITQRFFKELFTDIVSRQLNICTGNLRLKQGVRDALDLIEQQKILCYTLIHDADSVFAFQLLNNIREAIATENSIAGEADNLRISYMCGGIFSVILEWIRNDCKPGKETVAQIIELGVRQTFVKTKLS